ncbi:carbohydrate ABC transporter membrane protein 2 (CUT1 family) [Hydrogenoanaerobacterium saccharovorans]|uniref:Carbohydrate ABC transporter membrane protein 2, CUT1 family n=1 Tax=Hydrogenoanaerobacterium saccharovorans TaxID=474960 RepID=A0A1H8AW65_9FIRM|nr:carbohydrate ABC transporter permease [Hydrogenoanaerobacterium saccharovorans]RPF47755.1 carbohydrate ABC transporter membrane protein 2 (CUT1 family) [Hydrogenoanaerobacterium saccharovorans]SEM74038.1 carbohydrate ABC transporter membrane protein 2, CUT1 family [Hydrogenoanaerobacterium saccharovorans]
MNKLSGRKIFTYVFLTIAVFVSLFPFYFMFVSASNTNNDILSIAPKLTFGSNLLKNYANLNKRIDIGRVFLNSVIITFIYTALSVLLHSMAGYALTKFNFKGKGLLFGVIMVTMMIPSQVLYVPLFTLMNTIGWANSYQAVILPALANAFGIFLMRQNMMAFPTALMEAARIDGYGEISLFFKIVLPNMKPAMGALGIYMFMSMWNSFMWPLIILGTKSMYNFPVALSMLNGVVWRKDYGVIMLATSLATLPIMLIFFVFQKQFVSGVMGGAVKE